MIIVLYFISRYLLLFLGDKNASISSNKNFLTQLIKVRLPGIDCVIISPSIVFVIQFCVIKAQSITVSQICKKIEILVHFFFNPQF